MRIPKRLITIILVIIVIISLFKYRPKPYEPTSYPTPIPPAPSGNLYQSDNFKFKIPDNFNIEKIYTTDGRVLENWRLTESSESPTTILVTLFSTTKDLVNFEPIQERRRDTTQYIEEVGHKDNMRGVLFRTIDGKGRDIFFSNKRQILIVAYIAQTTDPSKEDEFQTFIENIDWK